MQTEARYQTASAIEDYEAEIKKLDARSNRQIETGFNLFTIYNVVGKTNVVF